MPPITRANPPPPPINDEPAAAGRRLSELLARAGDVRRREYRYRFGQCVVFGLPVIALQLYGRALGPTDSERWVSLLQALLAGWVVYVNLGMLFEGLLTLPARRKPSGDLVVVSVALLLYLYSLISAAHGIVTSRLLYRPLMFHACVVVLGAWAGWKGWKKSEFRSQNAE